MMYQKDHHKSDKTGEQSLAISKADVQNIQLFTDEFQGGPDSDRSSFKNSNSNFSSTIYNYQGIETVSLISTNFALIESTQCFPEVPFEVN